ncbi:MAG: hypothetical protein JO103_13525 [Candidatus Eremiobacteraeota bacterium]|nr:hypothetical protein [Candidatus Eremiobacteraeota bacterium]
MTIRSFSMLLPLMLALGATGVAQSPSPAPAPASSPAGPQMTIPLAPQHDSKLGGHAAFTHVSMNPLVVDVQVTLDGVFVPENSYPAGIYTGTCASMSAKPAFTLKPLVGGTSLTRVTEPNPPRGPFAVAVFDTTGAHTIACGELPTRSHDHE